MPAPKGTTGISFGNECCISWVKFTFTTSSEEKCVAFNLLQSLLMFRKLKPAPPNTYGEKFLILSSPFVPNGFHTIISETSNTGELKLKLRCCLHEGYEYFESSP